MNFLRNMALALVCALTFADIAQAKKIVSQKTQKRHAAAKKAAEKREAVKASLEKLSGQDLINALNKRNMALAVDIKTHQNNIKKINKSRGVHSVLIHGKSKPRYNARTLQQKAALRANKLQISLDRREINSNQIQITSTQKALMQVAAMQAQNNLLQALKTGTGLPADVQATMQAALKAAYNQGQADQSATDAQMIQDAYNQGYSDAQDGTDPSNDIASAQNNSVAPTSDTSMDQSNLVCDDQSSPDANGVCADGSDAIDISSDPSMPSCADGSMPDANGMCADGSNLNDDANSNYQSSCQDGSNATCADGTDVTQASCADQSMPDLNGVCADGSLVMCNDGKNSPACQDGSQPF
jgi:hypothetical protein